MSMNAKQKILTLIDGEEIEAISLGTKGWWNDDQDEIKPKYYPKEQVDEALKILDFEFDSGFGCEEGCRVFVWTKNVITIKTVYDGAENYVTVPRHPSDIVPIAYGGG